MAFKVEMVRGKPDGVLVYELDSGGVLMPTRFTRTSDVAPGDLAEYSCSDEKWRRALDVGKANGWIPLGTLPSRTSIPDWLGTGKLDFSYEPEEWRYCKTFLAEDAAALAAALQRTPGDSDGIDPTFKAFLNGGQFDFAWGD